MIDQWKDPTIGSTIHVFDASTLLCVLTNLARFAIARLQEVPQGEPNKLHSQRRGYTYVEYCCLYILCTLLSLVFRYQVAIFVELSKRFSAVFFFNYVS